MRCSFLSGFKMVMVLFLVGVIFFSFGDNVYAKKLEIDDVYREFEVFANDNELGLEFSSSLNKEDKTINVYYLSTLEEAGIFKYTSDYVEYDIRDVDIGDTYMSKQFFSSYAIIGMIKSILKLGGYDYDFIYDNSVNYDYEDYGISFEIEEYNYNRDDDNGHVHVSGSYFTYFKMSLETDKFSTFFDKIDDDNEEDEDKKTEEDIISSLKPIIIYDNVYDNSVTIYPYVDYEFDDDREVFCYIYRSFDRDGEYEKLGEVATNCTKKMVGVVDSNLDSDTTYYYKALIVDGEKFSDVLEVTTKKNIEKDVNNPETGGAIYLLICIIIGSLALMFYIKFSVKRYE